MRIKWNKLFVHSFYSVVTLVGDSTVTFIMDLDPLGYNIQHTIINKTM